jgi:hypothetical protein
MKCSSANPVKAWAVMILDATSQDQFVAERYICYKSDPVAPHSAITGIAEIALRYQAICSRRHVIETHPSYKFIKQKLLFKFNGPRLFTFK